MKNIVRISLIFLVILFIFKMCSALFIDGKNNFIFDATKSDTVSAENFVLYLDDENNMGEISDSSVMEYANFRINNELPNKKDSKEVYVDKQQLLAINNAYESGVYELTLKYKNNEINILVFVADKNDLVQKNIVMFVNDFTLTTSEANHLSEEYIIEVAAVKVYNTITGHEEKVSVDYSQVKSSFGSYDVFFTASSNQSVNVKATVGDNLIIVDNIAMAANDIIIDKEILMHYIHDEHALDNIFLEYSDARVWNIEDNKDLHSIDDYSTHIETNNNEVADMNNDESITAQDFSISAQEVGSLTNESVIDLANASAWKNSTNENVEIRNVDYSLIKDIQGSYDVTFKTEKGTQITRRVFVGKSNPPTIDEKRGIVIFANDYEVKESEIEQLSQKKHIELSSAKIIDLNSNEEIDIAYVDVMRIKKEGKYSAKFGTEKKHYGTVELSVVNDGKNSVSLMGKKGLSIIIMLIVILIIQIKKILKY